MSDPHIGTLSEKSLHSALKEWYQEPGDQIELRVDGYVVDIVRGAQLVEIQTRNFSQIRRKLTHLLEDHPVHLVHPIPAARWIVRLGPDGEMRRSRRKSPINGTVFNLFGELVRIPDLAAHPNFSVEALLVHEEVSLIPDGNGSWRRKGWSIHDRRLLDVVGRSRFSDPKDFTALLPDPCPDHFTNRELAQLLGESLPAISKFTYCLRKMGILDVPDKRGNAYLFSIVGR